MKPHEWEQKTATEDWGSSTYWVCKDCGVEGGTESEPKLLGFITKNGLEPGAEDCDTSVLINKLYSEIETLDLERFNLKMKTQRLKMKTQRQRQELKRLNRTIKGIRDIVLMCETLKRAQGE